MTFAEQVAVACDEDRTLPHSLVRKVGEGMPPTNSSLPAAGDLQATWVFVEEGVELIMTRLRDGMSYQRYMELYTSVYNYCVSSRMNTASEPFGLNSSSRGGANLMGADLYKALTNYFVNHLKDVRQKANGLSDDALLTYYTDEWKRYTTGASYVNRLFTYLNRHWIKREKDEGRKSVYPVYTLALVSWRDHFYRHIQTPSTRLTDAVLRLIEKVRNGETIDTSKLQRVVDSLTALGIDEADVNRLCLDIYREAFERPFLVATELYYKAESEAFLAENSVNDYMKKAEARLQEEEDRVELYLHSSSKKALVTACETVLVKSHSDRMQEVFQALLDEEREDDLRRMYALLNRIPEGLAPLRERFEAHVKKAGTDAIDRIAESGKEPDPRAYVDALLLVHQRSFELVQKAFSSDTGFNASLDKACREYVNRNKATGTSGSKSPELLSRHADGLLKKSNKAGGEEEDMEAALNRTMTIFKYIEDKDVFQKFYSKMLARRLVQDTSASDDAEASMISKLKDSCGFEYTSKLQRMFQDIAVCKELNNGFKSSIADSEIRDQLVEFNVLVLGTAHWPLQPPSTELILPTDLLKTYDRFVLYYNNKHSGRRLSWLHQMSRNEVKALYTKPNKIFSTSTFQAAVLMQFNTGGDSLSYKDIQRGTKIADEQLRPVLQVLQKFKVIEHDEAADTYELNLNFKNPKVRINLNMPIKAEQKAESADVMKAVDEDRRLLIQAIIVRIMKSRKTLKHQTLIQETVSQLSSRFSPKVSDIKRAIDTLLDKEYLQRMDNDRNMLEYLA